MERSEFEALRKKVFGAIKHCKENSYEDKCADCAYENSTCFFRLQEDQEKLLYVLDSERRRLNLLLLFERSRHHAGTTEIPQR